MKQKNLYPYMFVLWATFFNSCTSMYQVFETTSTETKIEKETNSFANTDIEVQYNFWADGGKVCFTILNKKNAPIYIDWDKSHLIYNGSSNEYWNDVEESNSFYSGYSTSFSLGNAAVNISGNSSYGNAITNSTTISRKVGVVSTSKSKPKKIVQIPPNSSIVVTKFSIINFPFFDCNFNLKKTSVKTPSTNNFTKADSPLTFRNYISYSDNADFESTKTIDNEFFISSISFISKQLFLGKSQKLDECDVNGAKLYGSYFTKPYKSPSSFYLKIK